MIKNLLFIGKVIYLVSPESDVACPQEEAKEEKEQQENGEEEAKEEKGKAEEEDEDEEGIEEQDKEEEEEEEEEDDKDDRPPSLLWLMKKLSLMAKREAAYTPKVPLKVGMETTCPLLWLNSDYNRSLTDLFKSTFVLCSERCGVGLR